MYKCLFIQRSFMNGGVRVQDLSLYFRALADRKRFRIVQFLADHEQVRVTELGEHLRLSQPLISWHLRVLRRAGIVKTRRSGREVLCSLNRRALEAYEQRVDEMFGLRGAEPTTSTDAVRPMEAVRHGA
jgi:ArsR family transcriptional regulator, arsenate/arsenite/antimonite-responsive transcriptional repressor